MDEKQQQVISCKVSADEAEAIKAAAATFGMSVSEYVRSKVLAPAGQGPQGNFDALLRYLIYITNRTHMAVYAIAGNAGTLTTDRLQTIYDDAVTEGLRCMAELPERMAKTQAQIAAQTNTAPPAAE